MLVGVGLVVISGSYINYDVINMQKNIVYAMKNSFKYAFCCNRYYRNESSCNDDEDGCNYTLTITLNFPHDDDTVYIAHCFPYTYRYLPSIIFEYSPSND